MKNTCKFNNYHIFMQVFLRRFCSVITSFNYNAVIMVILFTNFTLTAVACALFNMRFMIYFFIL